MYNDQNLEATNMSSVGGQINCGIQEMEFSSSLKRNELLSHEKMCMKLKCLFLSEISQSEKAM